MNKNITTKNNIEIIFIIRITNLITPVFGKSRNYSIIDNNNF